MITTPEKNIDLSDDQTKQLDEFQTRLGVTQGNIDIASKALVSIKKDVVKAQEELAYVTSQVDVLKGSIINQEDIKTALNDSVAELETRLVELRNEEESINKKLVQAEEDSKLFETNVIAITNSLTERESAVKKEEERLDTEKQHITKAKDILTNALKDIAW